ncbi:MAG TPA: aminodeoxychorismate/anthranilate synthase component II [Thermoanaerobaculia bacterium]|nr:aminodeoxychorismate/anthranilate synthase component II [Thermoanaerobaculia bacterium]
MILVIDNYDSFTYNLVQVMAAAGAAVEVVRNDAEDAGALLARRPAGVVLSPGPGRPEDSGVSMELLARRPALPLLGVCLGHQALGVTFGATVGRAERLMHGKTSSVRHDGEGLFAGLPDPFEATRYHSLDVVAGTLPAELVPVAWSDDGCLMGMRHRELPWWGVQFHPESILTSAGPELLANFLRLCGEEVGSGSGLEQAPLTVPVGGP